jgi:hypothetical protein
MVADVKAHDRRWNLLHWLGAGKLRFDLLLSSFQALGCVCCCKARQMQQQLRSDCPGSLRTVGWRAAVNKAGLESRESFLQPPLTWRRVSLWRDTT